MKYCVIKNTVTVIDGSENSVKTMLQNAISSGFLENEVEILTEEKYQLRLLNTPQPPQPKTQIEILQETVDMLVISVQTNLGEVY